jgi:hypothetical protein
MSNRQAMNYDINGKDILIGSLLFVWFAIELVIVIFFI